MQQAEGEGDQPGMAMRQGFRPARDRDQFAGHEDDAQRHQRLDDRRGEMHELEGRQRQGYAVRHGERRDRLHQPPVRTDQQEQPQHEHQVIRARQDVLDPQPQVGRDPQAFGRRQRQPAAGLGRPDDVIDDLAVRRGHPQQDVGDRLLQPFDAHRLAVQGRAARDMPGADDEARRNRLAGRRAVDDARREVRDHVNGQVADHRLLPDHVVAARRRLGDLDQRRAHLMREHESGRDEGDQQGEDGDKAPGEPPSLQIPPPQLLPHVSF